MSLGSEFQLNVANRLNSRPFISALGLVTPEIREIEFGFPGGSHDPADCWVYKRTGTSLEMLFGFYDNFTPNDLICKVIEIGEQIEPGTGGTIQFNSKLCVSLSSSGSLTLSHHGLVAVIRRICRHTLERAIKIVAETQWNILISGKSPWPLEIGTTADISSMLDDLFQSAYCVEQAKRKIRQRPPLKVM